MSEVTPRGIGRSMMVRYEIRGSVVTVDVRLKRLAKSCAGAQDFSTFDTLTDSYAWRPFEDIEYKMVPIGRKENIIALALYFQFENDDVKKSRVRRFARRILEEEFFSGVCGVRILWVGEPKTLLPARWTKDRLEENTEYSSERFEMFTYS